MVNNLEPSSLQAIPEEDSARSSCASSLRSVALSSCSRRSERKARALPDDARNASRDDPRRPDKGLAAGLAPGGPQRPEDSRTAPGSGDDRERLDDADAAQLSGPLHRFNDVDLPRSHAPCGSPLHLLHDVQPPASGDPPRSDDAARTPPRGGEPRRTEDVPAENAPRSGGQQPIDLQVTPRGTPRGGWQTDAFRASSTPSPPLMGLLMPGLMPGLSMRGAVTPGHADPLVEGDSNSLLTPGLWKAGNGTGPLSDSAAQYTGQSESDSSAEESPVSVQSLIAGAVVPLRDSRFDLPPALVRPEQSVLVHGLQVVPEDAAPLTWGLLGPCLVKPAVVS